MKRFSKALVSTIKILLILYFILTIIISAVTFIPVLRGEVNISDELMLFYWIAILLSFIMVTFFVAPFISWYLMIKLGNDVIDKMDGSEHKSLDNHVYYRDVPTNYNPAVASLILNKWFEKKTDITTMLLYFIKRLYLKKEGNEIIYTGKDTSDLTQSELYFVKSYSDGSFVFETWRDFVIKEAKSMGYVENPVQISIEEFRLKTLKIAAIIFVSIIMAFNFIPDILLFVVLIPLIYLLIPFGIIFLLILGYRRGQVNVKLTKKGIEEQEKLVKLRKYLTEFSSLQTSDDEAMVLWEDYLIYAVALGVNNSIVEKSIVYNKMNYGNFNINQKLAYEISQHTK